MNVYIMSIIQYNTPIYLKQKFNSYQLYQKQLSEDGN